MKEFLARKNIPNADFEFNTQTPVLKLVVLGAVLFMHGILYAAIIHSPLNGLTVKPVGNSVAVILVSEKQTLPVQGTLQTTEKPLLQETVKSQERSEIKTILEKPLKVEVKDMLKPVDKTKRSTQDQAKEQAQGKINNQMAVVKLTKKETTSSPQTDDPSASARSMASAKAGNSAKDAQQALDFGTNCPKPEYPKTSRRLFEEGIVTLRFLVDTDGQVLQAEVLRTSGFKRLDEAARIALSKCQFRSSPSNRVSAQTWSNIHYSWRLK